MKNLLIEEMKRSIELLEKGKLTRENWWDSHADIAELKQILRAVRRHSVKFEKETFRYENR